MWRKPGSPDPFYTDMLELDLGAVEPSLAGPKRPQDRVPLSTAASAFTRVLAEFRHEHGSNSIADMEDEGGPVTQPLSKSSAVAGANYRLADGAVVIAAITSCTNTSNPAVMLAAGMVAKKALDLGLKVKPWVKTSLAPGSQVVTDYLARAGLQDALDAQGFDLVGYGCTTCIGNSGPLPAPIHEAIEANDLIVCSVLSGNRNFEGRVHPLTRANYLASPPLVVAYAIAGTMDIDFEIEPLGKSKDGKDVFLRDIWPSSAEVSATLRDAIQSEMFTERYGHVFEGSEAWRSLDVPDGEVYAWDDTSTYVRKPPFFEDLKTEVVPPGDIAGARVLAVLGDSVTTDHISPAGSIAVNSPAGKYLQEHGVKPVDFNSYGSRRGNHEIMMRGTFANIRLRNLLAPGTEGGVTRHLPGGEQMSIYDAAMRYATEGVPLVILAGQEYGTGSSRDWAAKDTLLLGVRAVIAQSFERIHRSNLIGMGVLPLEFQTGESAASLGLTGEEVFRIEGIASDLAPLKRMIVRASGKTFTAVARLDTPQEVEYYIHGGILKYVLRTKAAGA
jgi:aconitate hydratase